MAVRTELEHVQATLLLANHHVARRMSREFESVLRQIPPRTEPYLPSNWLHVEIRERFKVLSHAGISAGDRVLEVGSGAHAIATVPLAFLVGREGHVTAVEKERWDHFTQVVSASGLKGRVSPLGCDAQFLPVHSKPFDIAVIVHGMRSMRNEQTIVRILSEMLRVASRVFVAESLPVARNKAQVAHLEMYNLREEIFEAALGAKDDLHYFEFRKLIEMVERAGCGVTRSMILDVELPHYLAFIPRECVERIRDPGKRDDILGRWQKADKSVKEHGAEHPPVAIISAERHAQEYWRARTTLLTRTKLCSCILGLCSPENHHGSQSMTGRALSRTSPV